jgi:hypothetical protein
MAPGDRQYGRLAGWRGGAALAALVACLLCLALAQCACNDARFVQLNEELVKCRNDNERLTKENSDLQKSKGELDKQVSTLCSLGREKRLEWLFYPKTVDIGRESAGIDYDGKGTDGGIRVYLNPIDKDGSIIKAAGSARIEFFDLSLPGDNRIATYDFPVESIGKQWESGFITYHYRFDCKWQHGRPEHPDITVVATFDDYLTGKTFTSQKVVTVRLGPTSQPATAPTTGPACSTAPTCATTTSAPAK